MFSGLNPPDGEVQTIRGFSAQIPIFGCVKNFMHLISFCLSLIISNYPYLSLIISNYTSAKRMSYLCVRNAKILTLGILKTSFSLHSLNRIIASEIARIINHSSLAPPNNAPFLLQIGQNTLTLTLGRRGIKRRRRRGVGRRRGLPLTLNS